MLNHHYFFYMETLYNGLKIILDDFIRIIQDEMSRKKIDATKNASNSLKHTFDSNVIRIEGLNYIEYLNRGRPPGKFPPLDVIEKWVDAKKLDINPELVQALIGAFGTRIYQNRELGIKLEDKVFALEQEINDFLPNFISDLIKVNINASFIRINKFV